MADGTRETLAGKRALVTGAGRGIGRVIALALAEAGADVAVTARTGGEIEELAGEIERLGRRAVAIRCDVADQEQVRAMVQSARDGLGGVDILVNNAGAAGSHKFLDHDDALWHHLLTMNMTSVYYVTKAVAPLMVEQRSGRIITIASIAARTGSRYIAAYAASKHGVLGLMRALAVELGPYNITVNTICPGYVDTPMTRGAIANIVTRTGTTEAQARAALEQVSPRNRLIGVEEVARVAVFLAQDASKGINGQAINVDDGMIMS